MFLVPVDELFFEINQILKNPYSYFSMHLHSLQKNFDINNRILFSAYFSIGEFNVYIRDEHVYHFTIIKFDDKLQLAVLDKLAISYIIDVSS